MERSSGEIRIREKQRRLKVWREYKDINRGDGMVGVIIKDLNSGDGKSGEIIKTKNKYKRFLQFNGHEYFRKEF